MMEVSMRKSIQQFGRSLSAMVMPNIGAFIAWGLITAMFIPGGWFPNEHLAIMVSPMLKYLLPTLIAFTAGKNISGYRGGVAGAVAAMGVIIGTDTPMFLGAMIMGPLAGWCIKKFDSLVKGKVGAGFEMLVDNFSLGIIAMLLAITGYLLIGDCRSRKSSLPEQRRESWHHDPLGHPTSRRDGALDAFPGGSEPGSRSGNPIGLLGVRKGHDQAIGSGRGCHSAFRRDSRDLFPLCTGSSDVASADYDRQCLRALFLHVDRLRACRPGLSGKLDFHHPDVPEGKDLDRNIGRVHRYCDLFPAFHPDHQVASGFPGRK